MKQDFLFPVPFWIKDLEYDEKTLKDLKDTCLSISNKFEGRAYSNRGGYQSKDLSSIVYEKYPLNKVFESINYAMRYLEHSLEVKPHVKFKLSNMWININKRGDFNVSHNHSQSIFAGVIYISCANETSGVVFENPHPAEQFHFNNITNQKSALTSNHVGVASKPGTMYVFPSWLYHHVPEYCEDDERITIAFNIQ